MNVNDRWMLEQMQQLAAAMAASLPKTVQNTDAKPEKGESFQDMMNKVQDKKTEAPKKDAVQKEEPVQSKEPVEEGRKVEVTKNADGTETKKVPLTAEEAAMVAAGYAALSPVMEDGTVWLAVFVGEGSAQSNPLVDRILLGEERTFASRDFSAIFVDEWVVEPSEELTAALEKLLQKAGDPRSAESILGGLEEKLQNAQPKLEIVVTTPETEQAGDQDETGLGGEVNTAQPLFKDVKAAPVKVGENFQLDTEQPDMDAQLAENIRHAAQQGLRQLEIRLSPENLGELTVKLTQNADGVLQVVLHAANPKAANLLTQHLDGLNAALQGYSQTNEVQVHVQRGEDSQQAQQQQYQQADPDGHNRQQQQQQRQEQHSDGQDFVQRLRLGLFNLEDII